MNVHNVFTLLGSIVIVALVTTIGTHGGAFAGLLTAGGNALKGNLSVAEGNKA